MENSSTMTIKSFGCSFIWGSEMPDEVPYHKFSKLTWPALLAEHLQQPYQCYARAGPGNLYIAEQVLTQAALPDPGLFIINWTFIDRFDYTDPYNDSTWHTCRPGETDANSDFYYRNFHSQFRDKLTTLMYINLCVETLQKKHIPFVMTAMDNLIFETKWHATPGLTDIQENIKTHIFDFDGYNFVDWAAGHGHAITPQGHLLNSGHQACFEYIKNGKQL